MSVHSCRLLRPKNGEYDRRKRGTYRLRWRIKATTKTFQRQMLEGSVAGVLPVVDNDGNNNWPLPRHGDLYDLASVPAYNESTPYYAGGFTSETESCVYADHFIVNFLDDDQKIADVDVLYTPLQPGEDPLHRTQTDPLKRPAKWHWESESYTKPADRDVFGRPYVNACGKSFDRPPVLPKTRGVHVARFNVADQNAAIALSKTYEGAVNYSEWSFWDSENPEPVRSVICRYVRSFETMHECPISYVPVEMAFVYANDGETWDSRDLNEGFGYFEEDTAQTYGYATATADFESTDATVAVSTLVVLKDSTGSTYGTLGATIANNMALSGLAGDQVPVLWSVDEDPDAWVLDEPVVKKVDNEPSYINAVDKNGDRVAEPVLLRRNGLRLPEGMIGNFITGRLNPEVNFNSLNDLLSPPQE